MIANECFSFPTNRSSLYLIAITTWRLLYDTIDKDIITLYLRLHLSCLALSFSQYLDPDFPHPWTDQANYSNRSLQRLFGIGYKSGKVRVSGVIIEISTDTFTVEQHKASLMTLIQHVCHADPVAAALYAFIEPHPKLRAPSQGSPFGSPPTSPMLVLAINNRLDRPISPMYRPLRS